MVARVALSLAAVAVGAVGCANVKSAPSPVRDAGVETRPGIAGVDASALTDVGQPPPGPAGCVNLQCRQVTCPGGGTTSVSGKVYAPNGTLPLFNVLVYVPNGPLGPFAEGVTCDRCGGTTARSAVTSALSNEQGAFKLTNVPVGTDIPLVVQVGKWRRRVTLPNVTACQDTALTDPNLTRLPRNRGEGDMPRIAVTTGSCDSLGCLLVKVGVDVAEMGVAGQSRAVTFYKGGELDIPGAAHADSLGPPNMTDAAAFWRSEIELAKHDLTLLCECNEQSENKGAAAYDAMAKYLARGGRIFGTDFMYVWYRDSSDAALSGALNIVGGAPAGSNPLQLNTTFQKGKALADWMKFVDPAITYGELAAQQVFENFNGAMAPTAQVWASSLGRLTGEPQPRIVTINTPAGAPKEQQCGRAVHLDAHISNARIFIPGTMMSPPFPMSCASALNKGEEALAFLFFDLAACIQDDAKPIIVP